jgi:hypothetical protein
MKPTIITVIRDFGIYDRLVKNNVFNRGAVFAPFDNTKENKTITNRYNEFLDFYDYSRESWFVFCHEDFELKEDLSARLKTLDKNIIYGPIGSPLGLKIIFSPKTLGLIYNSNKDGSGKVLSGALAPFAQAGALDCQCLIVHSGLIAKYKLRFDENLRYDMYVEDFCISAREEYGVGAKILQLKCQHYSWGNITAEFWDSFDYLRAKHKTAKNSYLTTSAGNKIIGRYPCLYEFIISWILRIAVNSKRVYKIRFFKIPLYWKKISDVYD